MSLQKTKIDWTDCVCNPVVGCPRGCEYCYARKLNTRFKWIKDFSKPQFFPERLKQLDSKKPMSIFVNSMSDIAFWSSKQLGITLQAMTKNRQHKYIALTKDLFCYLMNLIRAASVNSALLSNIKGLFFVGETITKQSDIKLNEIGGLRVVADFINIEPLLEPINLYEKLRGSMTYRQIIIGAETGNRKGKVIPEKKWIDDIVRQADEYGISVFMKESLRQLMGDDFRQDRLIWEVSK